MVSCGKCDYDHCLSCESRRQDTHTAITAAAVAGSGSELVGRRISIFWPRPALEWFEGELIEFNPENKQHRVHFGELPQ